MGSSQILNSEGVISLDVSMGSRRRPTMFQVISSQANFNTLLGNRVDTWSRSSSINSSSEACLLEWRWKT